jgi:hypothetical protein
VVDASTLQTARARLGKRDHGNLYNRTRATGTLGREHDLVSLQRLLSFSREYSMNMQRKHGGGEGREEETFQIGIDV